MALYEFLNPVFNPLLALPDIVSILILSFLIAVIITVIYKYTTNQDLMKRLKTELKELQKEMKELRDKPDEMMKVNKKVMQTNMKYMGQSFKSTIYTFLPIILLFGWMSAHYANAPLAENEQFQIELDFAKDTIGTVQILPPKGIDVIGETEKDIVEGKTAFTIRGDNGYYTEGDSIKFQFDEKIFYKDVIIGEGKDIAKKEEVINDPNLKKIIINYKKNVLVPMINLGWLGTYIIFSIIFSMSLRKLLKVY